MNKIFFLFSLAGLIIFSSCHRNKYDLEPKISFAIQDRYLRQLPAPFPPLTEEEKRQDWGREYLIGISFARQLDLYQAVTAFRRADILAPPHLDKRKLEIQYEILLCYYFGQRYQEVIDAYQQSKLNKVNDSFPAFQDLLVILYDAYQQTSEEDKALQILQIIHHYYPETYEKLLISSALLSADLPRVEYLGTDKPENHYLTQLLNTYETEKKSVAKAQLFNAALPGSGYFYIGQKQTALTAFLVNGLFIAAAVHFFQKGEIAAGIITTSFEAGWYFGGIYGAGQETKFYNQRLYERNVTPMMNQCGLFPALMLNYGF